MRRCEDENKTLIVGPLSLLGKEKRRSLLPVLPLVSCGDNVSGTRGRDRLRPLRPRLADYSRSPLTPKVAVTPSCVRPTPVHEQPGTDRRRPYAAHSGSSFGDLCLLLPYTLTPLQRTCRLMKRCNSCKQCKGCKGCKRVAARYPLRSPLACFFSQYPYPIHVQCLCAHYSTTVFRICEVPYKIQLRLGGLFGVGVLMGGGWGDEMGEKRGE